MASPFVKQELLDNMDCYLDINYGNEHDSVIDKVVALNKPIYAFSSTSHRAEARVFEDAEWQQMASAIADDLNL